MYWVIICQKQFGHWNPLVSWSQTAEGRHLPLRDFHQPRQAKTKLLSCSRTSVTLQERERGGGIVKKKKMPKAHNIAGLYSQRLGGSSHGVGPFLQGTDPRTIHRFGLEWQNAIMFQLLSSVTSRGRCQSSQRVHPGWAQGERAGVGWGSQAFRVLTIDMLLFQNMPVDLAQALWWILFPQT